MRITYLILSILLLISSRLTAQNPPATDAELRLKNEQIHNKLKTRSLGAHLPSESIGPTIFSGRVTDVDVSPEDPSHFYVAYASGGLWKTENNGTTFKPVFDEEVVMSIGDIAVDWEHDIVWVGTGENNSSRSSYSGTGLYVSRDGGQSWTHNGLPESHHIGRIVLHPTDTNTVWVAALGHLYSPNPERGIYKTTDGGANWERVLYVNDTTGGIDLVRSEQNPDLLFAAMWERRRRAWNFVESGDDSGIYRSRDGGMSWELITTGKDGFPHDEGTGRIGLDLYEDKEQRILYATLDNYNRRPKEEKREEKGLVKDDFRDMDVETFLALSEESLDSFFRSEDFPEKYTAKKVKEMIRDGEIEPHDVVYYLEDANTKLFDTDVIGAQVYRSTDDGSSWIKTHDEYLDDMVYSYGYYFGQIRVSPHDPDRIYLAGVPLLRSNDGGKTFRSVDEENVHVDHHALWINPDRKGHLILGNDGGINISYDAGDSWVKCNMPAVGQFYTVDVDRADPYRVYGGLQDNGVWYGPHTYEYSTRWQSTGDYPYDKIMGGDGMQVEIDTRTNEIVYTGAQFGYYQRIGLESGKRSSVRPQHDLGERPFRFNWQTPIHLSVHNQDIFYIGSQYVHRSFNRGEDYKKISPDLTKGGKKGDVPYGTLTFIHESPLEFGLIYTGSDDGLVHVSEDGGRTWTNISDTFPENLWVSRVRASRHEKSRAYVALNGYRWDDFTPYLYRTENYGKNWRRIGTDLPHEPINVVKEDPKDEDILYVGTDHGLYASMDGGKHFMLLCDSLPNVAVHDLVIHPEAHDLVLGTHGRSFYRIPVEHFRKVNRDSIRRRPVHIFAFEAPHFNEQWGKEGYAWSPHIEPEVRIPVYSGSGQKVTFRVMDEAGFTLRKWDHQLKQGVQYMTYDLSMDEPKGEKERKHWPEKAENGKYYLPAGQYSLEVVVGDIALFRRFKVPKPKKKKQMELPMPEETK